jgi:tellurite resistance protein
LHGVRADSISYGLAGYAIVMVLVQLRLLPLYLRMRFVPGFWAFTFSWCAVAILALHWLQLERPADQRLLAWLVCAGVTVLVGGIAGRSLLAIGRGQFVPRAQPALSRVDAAAPQPAAEAA